MNEYSFFKNINWLTIGMVFIITILGIANLYSLQVNSSEHLFVHQMVWFGIGMICFCITITIDYRIFSKLGLLLYIINVLLLIAVLVFGTTKNYSTRWLNFGFIMYQPSESMKLILAFVLAEYFGERGEQKIGFRGLIYPFILTLIPAILIKVEPDLGGAVILFIELAVILFMARIKRHVWMITLVTLIISIPLIWNVALNDYHIKRINAFMNPEKYAQTTAYQTIQATFAIGSGKMLGKGFTKGPISKGNFVPEQETDFAFSVWAEEFGYMGSLLLLLLYFLLIYSLMRSVYFTADHFGFYLSIAIISYLSFQIIMNFMMVTGLFPVIGVPLPLFSYGGTNMLITLISIGMIMSLYVRRHYYL